jgi:hypothetical protein
MKFALNAELPRTTCGMDGGRRGLRLVTGEPGVFLLIIMAVSTSTATSRIEPLL